MKRRLDGLRRFAWRLGALALLAGFWSGCGDSELQRMATRYIPESADVVMVTDFRGATPEQCAQVLDASGLQLYRIYPEFVNGVHAGVTAIAFPESATDQRAFFDSAVLFQFLYHPELEPGAFGATFREGLKLQAARSVAVPYVESDGEWTTIESFQQAFRLFHNGVYRVSDEEYRLISARTEVDALIGGFGAALAEGDPLLEAFEAQDVSPSLCLMIRDLADLARRCTAADPERRAALEQSFAAIFRTHRVKLVLPVASEAPAEAVLTIETEDAVAAAQIYEQLLAFRTYQIYVAQGSLGNALRNARFTVHDTDVRVALTADAATLQRTYWDLLRMLLRHFPLALD